MNFFDYEATLVTSLLDNIEELKERLLIMNDCGITAGMIDY